MAEANYLKLVAFILFKVLALGELTLIRWKADSRFSCQL